MQRARLKTETPNPCQRSIARDLPKDREQLSVDRLLLQGGVRYRPDIFWIAALSSGSLHSPQVPLGGMALSPVIALAKSPSRPPSLSARSFQAAVSPILGASSRPMLWQAALALRAQGVEALDLGAVGSANTGLARFKLGTGAALHALGATTLVVPG